MNSTPLKVITLSIILFCIVIVSGCVKNNSETASYSKKTKEFYNYYKSSKSKRLSISSRVNYINKAYKLSKELNIDTLSLKTLGYKASLMNKANMPVEYLKSSKEYLKMALKTNDIKATGNALFKIGTYYFKNNKHDSAYSYFNKSRIAFIELNDSLSVARRLLNMAIIQSNENDYYGSEKTAVQALKYLNGSNKKQLTSVYNCLAITTSALKNYDDALYWTNKCQAIQNNDLDYSILQNNKAGYLISKKEYAEAERILTQLLENDRIINLHQLTANIKSNLGYIYLKQKKKNKALSLLEESLSIRKNNNNTYKILESYRRLSELFEIYYDFPNAKKYADSAHTISSRTNNLYEKTITLKRKLSFTKGEDYKTLSEKYIKWNDSLQNKIIANRDLFAKIKYDTEQTRFDNLVLITKVTENALKIAQETYRRNLGILISSLLIITVGFITHNWRQRIKIASFNATIKTENRISKKVHDEMANDISSIKTLVENYIPTTNSIRKQLLNKLNTTYISARDIASESGEIMFSNSFGEDLKNLLMQYNSNNIKIITSISALDQLKVNQHKKNAIYRTLQELMVNMSKHSNASRVIIAHKKNGKYNEIKYSDNGIGVDVVKNNNGLYNAETRMKEIQGSFSFETSKGNGFKALIKFKA